MRDHLEALLVFGVMIKQTHHKSFVFMRVWFGLVLFFAFAKENIQEKKCLPRILEENENIC
ncbi:CLUMA_CG000527, isoform A [Clunio marinus]|uniref:CLUMA_CG000527, isoform A n=1 Tax=Clunio marinus TaxID=568069 RepID=A0A1J1HJP6_9DIPT|nr:CLUMA_CG000527, isoform A [Clunio marinus]